MSFESKPIILIALTSTVVLGGAIFGTGGNATGQPQAEASGWQLEADAAPLDMDDFAGRLLSWSYFKSATLQDEAMVIDVRTGFLAHENLPGLKHARPIPLDIFIPNFVARGAHRDQTLLILDEDGSNLKTLQYHLQKHGYEKYFFLEGGSAWALKTLDQRS